jgi:hypothetical protein
MESLPIPKFTARITVFDVRLDMSCGTQCTRLPTGLAKRVDSAGDQRRLARGKQEKAIHSEMRFHHIVYSHRVSLRRLSESLTQVFGSVDAPKCLGSGPPRDTRVHRRATADWGQNGRITTWKTRK